MPDDLLFREEAAIVQAAEELLAAGGGDLASLIGHYERLLGHYRKLLSHTQRITRISDLMQGHITVLNEQLTQSNAFQSQLLDTAITGIVELESRGTIARANQAFLSATGFTEDEVSGRPFQEIFVSDPATGKKCGLECCPSAPAFGVECSVTRKDGGSLTVLGNSASRRDLAGAIIGGIVSIVDVSDLVAAREAAKAADQAKSDFLATMSHEIRTPLNAVLGIIELLQESDLTERQQQQVKVMRSAADSLISLLNDILDLSRIESGDLELEMTHFRLRDTLSAPFSLLRMRASKKKLDFSAHIDEAVPDHLCGDPNRLRQIVLNLADNAIKFTHEGRVSVFIDVFQKTGEEVVLHAGVKDTGIGIPPERVSRIFDRFSQADSSMTRKYGGSGLGLAIVSQLAKAMGGSVWVESVPKEGSTFHVTVRCRIAESGAAACPQPPAAAAPGPVSFEGLRVLLVEDNVVNQLVAREILTRHGCEVVVAVNGREAVDAVDQHAFDVILMDLQMPEMDGLEATRLIRSKEKGRAIPIIAQTAHAFPEDKERCLAAGMDDHISKPITIAQLVTVLGRCERRTGASVPSDDAGEPAEGSGAAEPGAMTLDDLLLRFGNDTQRIRELVDLFFEVVPAQMADLEGAFKSGDCTTLGKLAHGVRGAFISFGAQTLADAAQEIERAAARGNLGEIASLVRDMTGQFEAFREEIQRLRQRL